MHFPDIGTAVPALGGLATALVSVVGIARGPGRLRHKLKMDAEIAALLPAGSEKDRLMQFVGDQIDMLVEDETERRRDWPTLIAAVACAVGLAAATLWLISLHHWWAYLISAPVGLVWLVFLYGIWDTGQKVKRDEKGNRVTRHRPPQ